MKHTPPRLAQKLLHRFCNLEFLEETEGDLNEQFYERLAVRGVFHARLHYFFDVFQTLSGHLFHRNKRASSSAVSWSDTIKQFLKITFRNMQRSRSTSIINIAGLAISLLSFFLIMIYMMDEMAYDRFHPNADNIYRMSYSYHRHGDGAVETDARTAGQWVIALKESTPEVKKFTRFSRFGYPGSVRDEKEDKVFVEQQFFWVDSTYTDIFSLPMVKGSDSGKLLSDMQYVIINETIANKYFGSKDPIGASLIYSRDGMDFSFIVGGVMKNYPSNSHFHPDFIANSQALNLLWKRDGDDRINSWRDTFSYAYIELEEGTDPEKIRKSIQEIFNKNFGDDAKSVWPQLVKLTDLHFSSGMLIELETPGDPTYLYIFGSIAALIILMACINYMNLATARSIRRSKEVGLRKTLGVSRSHLVLQFVCESILTTTLAAIISVGLFLIVLPAFNELSGKDFSAQILVQKDVLFALIALILSVGIISGCYPAFYLSAFRPVDVLKGTIQNGRRSENFRRVLVVVQFSVTVLLIVGTIVIQKQLSFINESKLSEFKDQVLTIRLFEADGVNKVNQFKELIRNSTQVQDVSMGTQVPRLENYGWIDTNLKAPSLGETTHNWQQLQMDDNFPSMFKLEFVSGRNFSAQNPADTGAVIINERALRDLGITQDKAIGLVLEHSQSRLQRTVIGVVKDFPYSSVRTQILPLVMSNDIRQAEAMYVKLTGEGYSDAIANLENSWKQVYPSTPFQFWFMDDEFARLYQNERRTAAIFEYFAGFTIFIGCLGLFGLASFTAEQKRKEIGIRKVVGASTSQVLLLLTSRFVKLILLSFFIGIPIAYFTMNVWLERFAYKTEVSWYLFLGSAMSLLLIVCVTVGIESLRAARANPVDSIRHE